MTGFGEIGQNDRFWAKMTKTRFFRQNPKMSLPYTYEAATLCKKLEKSYERILRSYKVYVPHSVSQSILKIVCSLSNKAMVSNPLLFFV